MSCLCDTHPYLGLHFHIKQYHREALCYTEKPQGVKCHIINSLHIKQYHKRRKPLGVLCIFSKKETTEMFKIKGGSNINFKKRIKNYLECYQTCRPQAKSHQQIEKVSRFHIFQQNPRFQTKPSLRK